MALQLLDIFKLLNKSNCGECGRATCMAFAQAVASGVKGPEDCPYLSREATERMGVQGSDNGFSASIRALRERVAQTDLESAATRIGAEYKDGRLSVRVLGREFLVDGSGAITSQCHVNNWIQWLILSYVSAREPAAPEGRWVAFGDLKGGQTAAGYFARRFEEPLRVIADEHTDVFFELLGVFGGIKASGFDSDYAISLSPLPNVPMLVLYWGAEEEFPSKLRVLFDPSVDSYLPPEIITGMGRGIVEMLQKIIPKHEKGILSLPYL